MATRSTSIEFRGGDRHRAAEAIADQRDRLTNAAQQRQQQFFDVIGNGKR